MMILLIFLLCEYSFAIIPSYRLGFRRSSTTKSTSLFYTTNYFTQRLDHFDASNTKTWDQRYFLREDKFKAGGPLFVLIDGEGESDADWLALDVQWVRYGLKHAPLYALLEHRFYGYSRPTSDMSTSNLRYLSSRQALADTAAFISYLRETYGTGRTVVFGGSYSGALAAWFREKYPHLADIVIASSAPVLALSNFADFLLEVTDAIGSTDPACLERIRSGFLQLQVALASDDATLMGDFRLCDPLNVTSSLDMAVFYTSIVGAFEMMVQYSNDNNNFFGNIEYSTELICKVLSSGGSALDSLSVFNAWILDFFFEDCIDTSYDNMITQLQHVDFDTTTTSWAIDFVMGNRQWVWQTCTEFGFYQTSDAVDQPFGNAFPYPFWAKLCQDVFGSEYDAAYIDLQTSSTNIEYGAKSLNGSWTVLPNGSVDPWHMLGIVNTSNTDPALGAITLFMTGTAHCADMYASSERDLPTLVDTRASIQRLIDLRLSS